MQDFSFFARFCSVVELEVIEIVRTMDREDNKAKLFRIVQNCSKTPLSIQRTNPMISNLQSSLRGYVILGRRINHLYILNSIDADRSESNGSKTIVTLVAFRELKIWTIVITSPAGSRGPIVAGRCQRLFMGTLSKPGKLREAR